jgi:dTDP-4-amino-4,6-dideoxy-D-galactose acyltransferase
MAHCISEGSRLVYATVDPTDDVALGFLHPLVPMDTKVVFCKPITLDPQLVAMPVTSIILPDIGEMMVSSTVSCNTSLEALALEAGAISRFYTDPRFPVDKAHLIFLGIIRNSIARTFANEVLIVHSTTSTEPLGVVTLRLRPQHAEVGMLAVDSRVRGRGIGKLLLRHAQQWAVQQGATKLVVVTSTKNETAMKCYSSFGFVESHRQHVFHVWSRTD